MGAHICVERISTNQLLYRARASMARAHALHSVRAWVQAWGLASSVAVAVRAVAVVVTAITVRKPTSVMAARRASRMRAPMVQVQIFLALQQCRFRSPRLKRQLQQACRRSHEYRIKVRPKVQCRRTKIPARIKARVRKTIQVEGQCVHARMMATLQRNSIHQYHPGPPSNMTGAQIRASATALTCTCTAQTHTRDR